MIGDKNDRWNPWGLEFDGEFKKPKIDDPDNSWVIKDDDQVKEEEIQDLNSALNHVEIWGKAAIGKFHHLNKMVFWQQIHVVNCYI